MKDRDGRVKERSWIKQFKGCGKPLLFSGCVVWLKFSHIVGVIKFGS